MILAHKSITSLIEKTRGLKNWQRLWVVTGVVYLFMIFATGYVLWPTRDRIDRDMVFSVTEEVKKYEGLAFAGEAPEKIFNSARKLGYSEWITALRKKYRIGPEENAGFAKIEKEYRQAVNSLASKRLILSGWLLAAWILPLCGLYAMGYIVDWINRGKM